MLYIFFTIIKFIHLKIMQKSKQKQQHDLKLSSKLATSILSPTQLKTSLSSTLLENQSFQLIVENRFDGMTYHDKSIQEIEKSTQQIIGLIKHYEKIVDKKIIKYYTQLREKPIQRQLNAEQLMQIYKTQQQLRKQLINFQEYQIRKIKQQEKQYDSIENIQFTIPIEITQSKKKIEELQSFIHIAQIRQKKRSEDLVKVQKNNLVQFQKSAMLRTTIQVQMIYQMTINERQMKINDQLYEFQTKVQEITKKLANLNRIAEEKHILVSSNKGLILLKQKKQNLLKLIQDSNKKMTLSKNTINNKEALLKRDIQNMKKQIYQKQQRQILIQKQLQEIYKKNRSFVIDENLNKSLRKSISYNYAETLLKMKKKQQKDIQTNVKLNLSMNIQNHSALLKPNFKVKKVNNHNHSSLSKVENSKNKINKIDNPIQNDEMLMPITIDKTRRNMPKLLSKNSRENDYTKRGSFYQNKKKMQQQYQQQIIIQQ